MNMEERFIRVEGGCSDCPFRMNPGDSKHFDPVTGASSWEDFCLITDAFCPDDGNFPSWCPLEEFGGEW